MTSKQTWVISQTQLHTWDTNLEIDLNVMLKVRQGETYVADQFKMRPQWAVRRNCKGAWILTEQSNERVPCLGAQISIW